MNALLRLLPTPIGDYMVCASTVQQYAQVESYESMMVGWNSQRPFMG